MKKLFISAILSVTFFAVQAGNKLSNEELNKQATEITRDLTNKVGLNEFEYIKVKSFMFDKLKAENEINDMYSNDPEMRIKKLQEIDIQFNSKLATVLNAKQQEAYAKLQANENANNVAESK